MEIELEIGNPVKAPTRKNIYFLTVEYMHGDADGETTKEYFYDIKNEDALKLDLVGVLAAIRVEDRDDISETVEKAYEEIGISDWSAQASRFRDRFYEGDMTCEGEPATYTDYDLQFYDADGIKRGVTVKVVY